MEIWQAAKQAGGEIAGSSTRQSSAGGRAFLILATFPATSHRTEHPPKRKGFHQVFTESL